MQRSEARAVPPGQRLVERLPVQHYGRVPTLDAVTWTLTISCETTGGPRVIGWDDLQRLPSVTLTADQHCVSKMTEQDVRWTGVPVREVIDLEALPRGCEHSLVIAEYGYSASVPVADLLAPRTLLATHRDDEPLTPERGGPVRLVVPHLYSWKGPKWLREIRFLAEPQRGFWEQRGYHMVGDPWRQERYSYQG